MTNQNFWQQIWQQPSEVNIQIMSVRSGDISFPLVDACFHPWRPIGNRRKRYPPRNQRIPSSLALLKMMILSQGGYVSSLESLEGSKKTYNLLYSMFHLNHLSKQEDPMISCYSEAHHSGPTVLFFCRRHDFTCCIQRWTLGCLRWKWCDQRWLSAEGPGILLYDVLVMLYDVNYGCGLKTIWSICIFKHIIHLYIYIHQTKPVKTGMGPKNWRVF